MKLDRKTIKKILFIITFGVLLLTAVENIVLIAAFIQFIFKIVSPIIMGLCIAFILNILLNLFEKKVFKFLKTSNKKIFKKLLRPLSVFCAIIVALGLITLTILIVVPEFIRTINTLVSTLPGYGTQFMDWVEALLEKFNVSSLQIKEFTVNWDELLKNIFSFLQDSSKFLAGSAVSITSSIIGGLFNFILSVILAIYILLKKEQIETVSRNFCRAFLPDRVTGKVFEFSSLSYVAFSNFIQGQMIEAGIFGTLCFIGMSIIGLPYAAVVSVLMGVTAIIPTFGAWIGTIISMFLILLISPVKSIIFLIFILILQQIESTLIYPKVVGDKVGLPGVLVLSAVIIGGNLYGVVGVLISVPLSSVIYTLLKKAIENRLKDKKTV